MEAPEQINAEDQATAQPTNDQSENVAAETTNTGVTAELDPSHPDHPNHHHHNSALLAASMGHSAVDAVRPHHNHGIDN